MQGAEPSWQEWIASNLSAGCDPADMQGRMIAAGWNEADARAALASGIGQVFPGLTAQAIAAHADCGIDAGQIVVAVGTSCAQRHDTEAHQAPDQF